MYLHLGQDTVVQTKDIVGIFDLDTTSLSKRTKEFLALAQKNGKVINTSNELPKSFVLTGSKISGSLYISQLSSSTLKGRVGALRIRPAPK